MEASALSARKTPQTFAFRLVVTPSPAEPVLVEWKNVLSVTLSSFPKTTLVTSSKFKATIMDSYADDVIFPRWDTGNGTCNFPTEWRSDQVFGIEDSWDWGGLHVLNLHGTPSKCGFSLWPWSLWHLFTDITNLSHVSQADCQEN